MKCQVPGSAWQKAWSRPCGSTSGDSVDAKTTPDVPRVSDDDARLHRARTDRARRLVSPARHHRRARPRGRSLRRPRR